MRDTLQQLFRALPRSAVAINAMPEHCMVSQCDAGALPRFVVRGHAVPVQGDELLASAIALLCNSMPMHC